MTFLSLCGGGGRGWVPRNKLRAVYARPTLCHWTVWSDTKSVTKLHSYSPFSTDWP